jgi:hypothetical protein
MSTTNTMKMDAELGWFFMHYVKDNTGAAGEATVDPLEILEKRFPAAERRSLRELSEELRATGPWIPKEIPASDWHGGY